MSDLPPELAQFVALLDAQPGPVHTIFQYCLAMLMVEAGKTELIQTASSENGPVCTFKTVAGDTFTLLKPPLNEVNEAVMMERLRQILDEEGELHGQAQGGNNVKNTD